MTCFQTQFFFILRCDIDTFPQFFLPPNILNSVIPIFVYITCTSSSFEEIMLKKRKSDAAWFELTIFKKILCEVWQISRCVFRESYYYYVHTITIISAAKQTILVNFIYLLHYHISWSWLLQKLTREIRWPGLGILLEFFKKNSDGKADDSC